MDIGAKEIDEWHKQRGWKGIGYHYVIRRSGLIEPGRPENEKGAHVAGFNAHSIGICWVGGKSDNNKPVDNRTESQKQMLTNLIYKLKLKYPNAKIAGHYQFNNNKACPCFNVQKEFGYLNNESYETNKRETDPTVGLAERQESDNIFSNNVNDTISGIGIPRFDSNPNSSYLDDSGHIIRGSGDFPQGSENKNRTKTTPYKNKTEREMNVKDFFKLNISLNPIINFFKKLKRM